VRAVVFRGIFGEETGTGRRDIGVSDVGEDYGGLGRGGVSDDADAELVGATLETYCIAHCGAELNPAA